MIIILFSILLDFHLAGWTALTAAGAWAGKQWLEISP